MRAFVAMVRVSMRQLLGRKWVILIGLVALLPSVVMVVQTRVQAQGRLPAEFTQGPLLTLFFFVLPLTSILLGSLALGEERRDGTLSFLVLRPRRREVITAAKLTAAWLAAWIICGLSGVLPAVILGISSGVWDMVIPVIVATGLSTLAYTGVFMVIGYLTRWAVLIGAAFLCFWETGIAFAADSLANISLFRIGLTAFAGMVSGAPALLDDAMGSLRPGAGGAVLKCLVIAAVSVGSISLMMRRRDLT
ncbi:MAG: ABC transporter permease [Acidimicrobiia bacterium]|nr:ABC transporter permease [Acidimicrobiia bacterium]